MKPADYVTQLEERIKLLEDSLPKEIAAMNNLLKQQDETLENLKELKQLILKLVIGKGTSSN